MRDVAGKSGNRETSRRCTFIIGARDERVDRRTQLGALSAPRRSALERAAVGEELHRAALRSRLPRALAPLARDLARTLARVRAKSPPTPRELNGCSLSTARSTRA